MERQCEVIRPQYHFRPSGAGLMAWDVRRLIELSKDLPAQAFHVPHGFRIIGRGFENGEKPPDIRYRWRPQNDS